MGASFDAATRYRRYPIGKEAIAMASLIAIGLGVALVVSAITTPYRDSWYGRWSRSEH